LRLKVIDIALPRSHHMPHAVVFILCP